MPVAPQPYRLDFHDDLLDDLRERLSRIRWPDEIPESGWQYGSNLAFMRRLTEGPPIATAHRACAAGDPLRRPDRTTGPG